MQTPDNEPSHVGQLKEMTHQKEGDTYIFRYSADNESRAACLRTFARYASDPELNFGWDDVKTLSRQIHEERHVENLLQVTEQELGELHLTQMIALKQKQEEEMKHLANSHAEELEALVKRQKEETEIRKKLKATRTRIHGLL